MWSIILKIAAAVGSLVIAGLSAYVAYKRSSNRNTGMLPAASAYACNGEYGYANVYRPARRVVKTGDLGQDVNTTIDAVNENAQKSDEMESKLDAIIRYLSRPTAAPVGMTEQPMQVPVAPVEPQNVVDANASDMIEQKAWEDSCDRAVIAINNGMDPAASSQVNVPVAPMTGNASSNPIPNPMPNPVQNPTATAMNYGGAGFGAPITYETFLNPNLFDNVMNDKYSNLMNPVKCDMGDPYKGAGIPQAALQPICGVNFNANPYAQVPNMNPYPQPVMPEPMPTFERPIDEPMPSGCYGHYGEPMPSTRQSIHYGHYGDPMPSTRRTINLWNNI